MADRIGVTFDTTRFDASMDRLARGLPDAGADAGYDTAMSVAARARGMMPHRSGRMAAGTRAERVADGAVITNGVRYFGWVEYGGTRGRRYVSEGRSLGPAVRGAERDMADQAARNVERISL